ncbi:Predicted transcriptional regulator [Nonomuraea solani]|uniref:Predicted transcriptional regulator n=1 Tax=Nonomuraea solani TaxID=1144553 RepID=A0A1H6F3M4_9ACTN|nr:BlaI/MecI/CopY family transcriptional regulator [Nonomuraea solani]SEH03726.1 Predicted transcriptional regulator [Nonomuraea solani]
MAEFGPLEQTVMECLWAAGRPLLIRGVLEQVNRGRERPLAYTTVQTVADRLARKGLVTRSRAGAAIAYAPVHSREEHVVAVMLDALSDLPDRGPVLARFAESVDSEDAQRLLDALADRSTSTPARSEGPWPEPSRD